MYTSKPEYRRTAVCILHPWSCTVTPWRSEVIVFPLRGVINYCPHLQVLLPIIRHFRVKYRSPTPEWVRTSQWLHLSLLFFRFTSKPTFHHIHIHILFIRVCKDSRPCCLQPPLLDVVYDHWSLHTDLTLLATFSPFWPTSLQAHLAPNSLDATAV